jgi:two-component system alkaline phosphatase synthesis response regulator PhoP
MPDKKIVMIVEDDKTIAEACQMKLQIDGFEVLLVGNGQEGIDLLKDHKPDIILLDIIMPKMNGFDFLEAYKKKTGFEGTKVIIMSNLGQDMDIEHGKELGACDYLIKANCGINEIEAKVKEWIDK